MGPQVKLVSVVEKKQVSVVEKKQVPGDLKGASGVCRNLRLIGDENMAGASLPGCSAANCPLGVRGELTLAGPTCGNYSIAGQSGVKGKGELHIFSLDVSTLVALKANEVPAALCHAVSSGGDYGC